MDVKEQLDLLYEICRQDLELVNQKEALKRLGQQTQDARESAGELKVLIDSFEAKKSQALKKRRALDEKLQLEKANLRKWESRAEKIKGEREYTALISEISTQKRSISGIESEISEVSQEIQSCEQKLSKTLGEHEEKLNSATTSYASVKERLHQEQDKLLTMEETKKSVLIKIPKVLRLRYERIYEKRAQQGVAYISNEVCQVCMRMVPPELFIRVLKGEIIEQCPSCQRILVAQKKEPEQGGK